MLNEIVFELHILARKNNKIELQLLHLNAVENTFTAFINYILQNGKNLIQSNFKQGEFF